MQSVASHMSNLLKFENLNYYFKTHVLGQKNQEASWTARCPSKEGFAAGFNINSECFYRKM